jgi:antitoxin CptB
MTEGKQMVDDAELHRTYWHSRRGMLELDLILIPFVKGHYAALDETDRACYQRLLREEDQSIFLWLLGRETPPDAELARIVERIIATVADPDHPA